MSKGLSSNYCQKILSSSWLRLKIYERLRHRYGHTQDNKHW